MITAEVLREMLDYDPLTGLFTWKVGRGRVRKGYPAGCLVRNSVDYEWVQIRVLGVLYPAHRLAWLHFYGVFPDGMIDHKNQDSTDNRIDNMRDTTHLGNSRNQHMKRTNKSGFTGVYWEKRTNKWHAEVKVNGRKNCLGRFDDIQEAARVVQAFRASMGFTALHGSKKRLQEA